jgi:hypothetical protein
MTIDLAVPVPVHGHGMVELRDARTGRVQHREEFENFIGPVGKLYQSWMNRRAFNTPTPGITASETTPHTYPSQTVTLVQSHASGVGDPEPVFPFSGMVLTDEAAAESPTTERSHLGAVIGWANRFPYSGSDVLRGTANTGEQLFTPTQVKFVFDWPTHAANSAPIHSIGWAALENRFANTTGQTFVLRADAPSYYQLFTGSSTWYSTSYVEGSLYIFRNNAAPFRVPWSTTTASVSAITGPTFSGVDTHAVSGVKIGSEWFVASYATSTIRVYPYATTGTLTSTRSFTMNGAAADSTLSTQRGLATDGTNLFTAQIETVNSVARIVIRKLNPADGTVLQTWTVSMANATVGGTNNWLFRSLVYDAPRDDLIVMWYTNNSVVYLRLDLTTGRESMETIYESVASAPQGMVSDGTDLFVIHTGGSRKVVRDNLGTRSLLASPITKTGTQTLKITYQIDFS